MQNNLTPSLEMDKFCALDTFPHSGSGQAGLIKSLCGLSKHSSGPVTLARRKWCAYHVTGKHGFQRQNCCSGWLEGRECLYLQFSETNLFWFKVTSNIWTVFLADPKGGCVWCLLLFAISGLSFDSPFLSLVFLPSPLAFSVLSCLCL